MGEEALKRIQFEISTLVAASPQPMNAGRIAREYDEYYGEPLNVYQYGFANIHAFLDDHPKLTAGIVEGQKCYKAGISDNADAQEIQMLIKGQKKKKKNRGGKRGNFHRNTGFTRSERYQQKPQFPNYARASLREPYAAGRRAGNLYPASNRSSFGASNPYNGPASPFSKGFSKDGIFSRLTVPENNAPFTSQPRCAETYDPSVGVTRILAALKDCDGRVPLYKLSAAYQKRFSSALDGEEFKKFFGTNNLKKIENTYLKDKVVVNALTGGRFIIASKQMLEEAREAGKKHAFTVIHKGEMKFDKPSLVTLKDHLMKILEGIYPRQLPINGIAVAYQRAHGVQVDPVSLFAKTWLELITGTLKGFFVLHSDKTVGLTDPFIRNLRQRRENVNVATLQPKQNVVLSAEQLGLAYESDSDDESDTESASQADSLDASSVDSTLRNTCNGDRLVSSSAASSILNTGPDATKTTPMCAPSTHVAFGFLRRTKRPTASNVNDQQNASVGVPSSCLSKVTEDSSDFSPDFTRSFAAPTTCLGRMSAVADFSSFKQADRSAGDSSLSPATATKPTTSVGKMMGVFKRFGITSSKRSANDMIPATESTIYPTDSATKHDDSTFLHVSDRFKSFYIVRFNGKKVE